ncbi:Ulp1 protease family, carboxy-terminal domain protein [Arachis hypogaea]|nr:Ulp1 protease family, carboxy-terminal domain protein [Arachis hypogaea]
MESTDKQGMHAPSHESQQHSVPTEEPVSGVDNQIKAELMTVRTVGPHLVDERSSSSRRDHAGHSERPSEADPSHHGPSYRTQSSHRGSHRPHHIGRQQRERPTNSLGAEVKNINNSKAALQYGSQKLGVGRKGVSKYRKLEFCEEEYFDFEELRNIRQRGLESPFMFYTYTGWQMTSEDMPKCMDICFWPPPGMQFFGHEFAVAAYVFAEDLEQSELLVQNDHYVGNREALWTLRPEKEVEDDIINLVVAMLTAGKNQHRWWLPTTFSIDGGIYEDPESLTLSVVFRVGSWESGKSHLVCGIPSRIPIMNDCDVLQTCKCWALVTDAKESRDSIPPHRIIFPRGLKVATADGEPLYKACHGKDLLQTNNLCGIDPYSRKVYYLDDPVHLLTYVPLHSGRHWYLMMVNMWEEKLVYLDLLKRSSEREGRINQMLDVARFIDHILADKRCYEKQNITPKKVSSFKVFEPLVSQQAEDSMNCGVWVSQWMILTQLRASYELEEVNDSIRMALAIYLVMGSHNPIAEEVTEKARRYWDRSNSASYKKGKRQGKKANSPTGPLSPSI